jgi:hypothetical protein
VTPGSVLFAARALALMAWSPPTVFGVRPTAHKPRAAARKIFLSVRKIAAGQQLASTVSVADTFLSADLSCGGAAAGILYNWSDVSRKSYSFVRKIVISRAGLPS